MNRNRQIARIGALGLALFVSAGPATAQPTRGFLSINGGVISGSTEVRQSQTFGHALFGPEAGRYDSRYPAGGSTAVDIGGGVKVWRDLAVGGGVSLFSRQEEIHVTAQLPHPFHFDRSRRIMGTASEMTRDETAVHVQAMWVASGRAAGRDRRVWGAFVCHRHAGHDGRRHLRTGLPV